MQEAKETYYDYKISGQLTRARRSGPPATLTQSQWDSTLKHFNHKCAYCLDGSYNVIEHFVSIRNGGGTTWQNCVPACRSCNSRKDRPNLVLMGDKKKAEEALERVRSYLASKEKPMPDIEGQPVLVGQDGEDQTFITCTYGAAIIMRRYEDGDVSQLGFDGKEMDKICETWLAYRAKQAKGES